MNGGIKNTGSCSTIMFANKNTHRLVKHPDIVQASTFGAFSFKMNDGGTGEIIILVKASGWTSCFLNPVTEVYVFGIHKKGLIKSADVVQDCFTNHHISPGKNIHFMSFIFMQMPQMIPRKGFRIWEYHGEPKKFVQGGQW